MSSDTAETVKRARELMDSGVDPMVLMSQLASLIMDIIAGTYNIGGRKCEYHSFHFSFIIICLHRWKVHSSIRFHAILKNVSF